MGKKAGDDPDSGKGTVSGDVPAPPEDAKPDSTEPVNYGASDQRPINPPDDRRTSGDSV